MIRLNYQLYRPVVFNSFFTVYKYGVHDKMQLNRNILKITTKTKLIYFKFNTIGKNDSIPITIIIKLYDINNRKTPTKWQQRQPDQQQQFAKKIEKPAIKPAVKLSTHFALNL